MQDYSQWDGIYDDYDTRYRSDGGCCGCLILIFAAIGFFSFLGWIF